MDILGFRAYLTAPACSFCGRRPGARDLVEGPGVRICASCLEWCAEVLEERRQDLATEAASGQQPVMQD